MTTTTAVPSSDVSDFLFNVQKLDEITTGSALTYVDRLGVTRSTAAGAMARFAALNPRGAWVTATLYQPRDLVLVSGTWYIALDTHMSGATFAGDLTAHWRPEQGVTAADLADISDAAKNSGLVKYDRRLNYVAGTVGAKFRETVSCKDQPWLCKGDGTADDSAAMQAFLIYIYGAPVQGYVPTGVYKVGDIDVPISGGRLNGSLKVVGDGINASVLKQKSGASSHVLRLYGTGAPVPNTANLVLQDIGFNGPTSDPTSNNVDGIILQDIAGFHIDGICVDGFNVGLHLKSALIGEIVGSVISSNKINLKTTRSPANGAYCNNITIVGGSLTYALQRGFDLDYANNVVFYGTQIERNCQTQTLPTGTVTISNGSATWTWTGHGRTTNEPILLSTSGTLPAPFIANKVYYAIVDTANTLRLSATLGGSDITASSAGSGTHTAVSPYRGAGIIRKNCITELGYSNIKFDTCWIEGNGISGIVAEYMSDAFGLNLVIQGGHLLGDGSSNQALIVPNFRTLEISNWNCVAAPSRVNVSGDKLSLRQVYILDLVRPSGVSSTIAENSIVNGADWVSGEIGSTSTLTYTGGTTSPTTNYAYRIQGKDVVLTATSTLFTSNAAGFTATGLDTFLRPSADRTVFVVTQDNGNDSVTAVKITTAGVLDFASLKNYVASGSKGTRVCEIRYSK